MLAHLDDEKYQESESGLETHPTADVTGDGMVNVYGCCGKRF